MNKLDNYIMGNLNSYLFSKYGYDDYGILKMEFRDRFIILSECNISNILSRDRQSTFLGMLDKETNILYLESFYYNHLNDNSEFQKKLLNEVQHEMEDYVKDRYNQYIKTNELLLKSEATKVYDEFYSVEVNNTSLREKMENNYLDGIDLNYFPKFKIDVPIRLNDICDYIVDRDLFTSNLIDKELNKQDIRICSNYSGVPDIFVNNIKYIGFTLLKQDKLNDMSNKVKEGKDPRSKELNKLRALKTIAKESDDNNIRNVMITFKRNDKELCVQCPIALIRRLDISDYYLPVVYRTPYNDMFGDVKWGDREIPLLAIKDIKFRGKSLYEDESL